MIRYTLGLVLLQAIFVRDILCCSCGCGRPDNSPSDDFSSSFDLPPLPPPSYDPPSKMYNNDYIPSVRIDKPICYSRPLPPPPPPPVPPPSVCKQLGIVPPSFFAPPASSCQCGLSSILPVYRRKIKQPKPSCLSQKLSSLLNNLRSYGQGMGGYNLAPLRNNYGCGCGY